MKYRFYSYKKCLKILLFHLLVVKESLTLLYSSYFMQYILLTAIIGLAT